MVNNCFHFVRLPDEIQVGYYIVAISREISLDERDHRGGRSTFGSENRLSRVNAWWHTLLWIFRTDWWGLTGTGRYNRLVVYKMEQFCCYWKRSLDNKYVYRWKFSKFDGNGNDMFFSWTSILVKKEEKKTVDNTTRARDRSGTLVGPFVLLEEFYIFFSCKERKNLA